MSDVNGEGEEEEHGGGSAPPASHGHDARSGSLARVHARSTVHNLRSGDVTPEQPARHFSSG